MTGVVGQECLRFVRKLRGGILGVGHSWVTDFSKATSNRDADATLAVEQQLSTFGSAMATGEMERRITEVVKQYVTEVQPNVPLAMQGIDSLATLELRQKLQVGT